MGKRKKSSRGPAKKIRQELSTTFSCLFCNHENSVTCTLDKKLGVGQLYCKVCGQTFQASINSLSAAIDVYSEWVDACEAVATTGGVSGKSADDSFVVRDSRDNEDAEDDALSDLDENEFA